jgi:hypothetical protein
MDRRNNDTVNATIEDAVKYLAKAIPKILCPQQEIKLKI